MILPVLYMILILHNQIQSETDLYSKTIEKARQQIYLPLTLEVHELEQYCTST